MVYKMLQTTQTFSLQDANLTYLILGVVLSSLFTFLVLIVWLIIKFRKNKKNTTGFIFEDNISQLVKNLWKEEGHEYFAGGTFEYSNQMFNIDALIITPKILLVFEFKSFKGFLKGDASDYNLTLVDYNNKLMKVSNPITQNQKHIDHLFKMLGYEFPVASVIVFEEGISFAIKDVPDDTFLVSPSMMKEIKIEIKEWSNSQTTEVINIDKFKQKLSFYKINTFKQNFKWNKKIKKMKK